MEATLQREHSAITCFTYEKLDSGIREEQRDHVEQFHSDCLLGVGKMAALIDVVIRSRRPAWNASHFGVPHVSKMSLAKSIRDLPSPYLTKAQTIAAWDVWMRRQRSARSLPAYFDEGEWERVVGKMLEAKALAEVSGTDVGSADNCRMSRNLHGTMIWETSTRTRSTIRMTCK